MKRAPKRVELEAQLHGAARSLLLAATVLMDEYEQMPVLLPGAPLWTEIAADAFECLEVLGVDPATRTLARNLRPWVGP